MAKGLKAPKQRKQWERTPWPKRGDSSGPKLHAAVGRALSSWEDFERELGEIFSLLVAGTRSKPARRAYYAVRTFEGRLEMLRAASLAFIAECKEDRKTDELRSEINDLIKSASQFSQRRNEIAHGVAFNFWRDPESGPPRIYKTFALYPSFANYKDRALDSRPAYCYTSVELHQYTYEFRGLIFTAGYVIEAISLELARRPVAL